MTDGCLVVAGVKLYTYYVQENYDMHQRLSNMRRKLKYYAANNH